MYEAEASATCSLPLPWEDPSRRGPEGLLREHGKATLEELFITVAREPLTLEGH